MSQPMFLRIFKDGVLVSVKQFTENQITIGKESEVQVDLNDDSISKIHAMIEKRGERYYICDLGSENGTYLNGESILDKEIHNGDTVKCGDFQMEFFIGIPKPKSKPVSAVKTEPPPVSPYPYQIPDAPVVASEDDATKVATSIKEAAKPAPPQTPAKEVSYDRQPANVSPTPVVPSSPVEAVLEIELPQENLTPEVAEPVVQASVPSPSPVSVPASMPVDAVDGKLKQNEFSKRTYAPASPYNSLDEIIKPAKGRCLEVLVAWGDRILSSHKIEKAGVITYGSSPKCDVTLPFLDSTIHAQPLMDVRSMATVFIPAHKRGRLYLDGHNTISLDDAEAKGRLQSGGVHLFLELQQGEMVRIDLGDNISLFVRYTSETPDMMLLPFGGLNTSEITALGIAVAIAFLLSIFVAVFGNVEKVEEEKVEEKKAKIIFKNKKSFTPLPEVKVVEKPQPKPEKIKEAKVVEKPKPQPKPKPKQQAQKLAGDPGKAGGLRPNKNKKIIPKKVVAENKGNVGRAAKPKTAGKKNNPTGGRTQKKDISRAGLLGAFSKGGTQQQLSKIYNSAGALDGASEVATGSGGGGSSYTSGGGLRDVGAGGKGTQTIGVSGIDTKGRGGGTSGYGSGSLGSRKGTSVTLDASEADFEGTVDKEAVRRVVLANIRQVKACYEAELNKNLGLSGKVVIGWTVQGPGRVQKAWVQSSTLRNSRVENCIRRRLSNWRFPEAPSGSQYTVTYPFVLSAR